MPATRGLAPPLSCSARGGSWPSRPRFSWSLLGAGHGGSAAGYVLDTPHGPVTVFSLHLASPRQELVAVVADRPGAGPPDANSALRQRQSEAVAAAAAQVNGPVLILGDFNTPPESVV